VQFLSRCFVSAYDDHFTLPRESRAEARRGAREKGASALCRHPCNRQGTWLCLETTRVELRKSLQELVGKTIFCLHVTNRFGIDLLELVDQHSPAFQGHRADRFDLHFVGHRERLEFATAVD
jgi:hypothetical protein